MMRVDYHKVFPAGMRAMADSERAVRSATVEPGLLDGPDLPGGTDVRSASGSA